MNNLQLKSKSLLISAMMSGALVGCIDESGQASVQPTDGQQLVSSDVASGESCDLSTPTTLNNSTNNNLLFNPSFEQYGDLQFGNWGTFASIPGWNSNQNLGDFEVQQNGIVIEANDGNALIELDGHNNTAMWQGVKTTKGNTYELVVHYSPRVEESGTDTNKVKVFFGKQYVGTLNGDQKGWQEHRFIVTAEDGHERVRFRAKGASDSYGGLIDNISLKCISCNDKNLIKNPSFEKHATLSNGKWGTFNAIQGWDIDNGLIEIQTEGVGGIEAARGDALAELDSHGAGSNSSISQTFETRPGQKYRLAFFYSPRVEGQNAGDTNDINVWWGDELLTTLSGDEKGWEKQVLKPVALGTSTQLRFEATGQEDTYGGLIDRVRLVCRAPRNMLVNGSFERFGDLNRGSWGTFNEIPGWVAESGLIEIQVGGTGGIAAKRGNAKIELDSHHAGSNSTVSQSVVTKIGKQYKLVVDYSPRVQRADTDTNDVEVMWNDEVVGTLGGDKREWQRHTFYVDAADVMSKVSLRGAGKEDTLGGLVDRVRLVEADVAPSITSTAQTTASAGEFYSYAVAVENMDEYANWTLDQAPEGMVMGQNGILMWDNPVPGTYDIELHANDGCGGIAAQHFTLTVVGNLSCGI